MNQFFIALCVAVIAGAQVNGYSAGGTSGYQADGGGGDYQLQGGAGLVGGLGSGLDSGLVSGHIADSASSASASANAGDASATFVGAGGLGGANDGSIGQSIPCQHANARVDSVSSSISYPNNKGEILIHRPAAIIVKRPPTKVVVNHPPLVVKPAPVVLHRPPAIVVRKVFVKNHPRPIKVEPVYVNVVKPPAEKYFVNEKHQASIQAGLAPVNVNPAVVANGFGGAHFRTSDVVGFRPSDAANYAVGAVPAFSGSGLDGADVNGGYQLLHNHQGLTALANLSGGSGNYSPGSSSASSSYSAPSY